MTIPMGTTHSLKVLYVEEHERVPDPREDELDFKQRSADVLARDWDVSDPGARRIAAEEQLGEGVDEDEWYALHAQWFINPTLNAAVLIVYRPKVASLQ